MPALLCGAALLCSSCSEKPADSDTNAGVNLATDTVSANAAIQESQPITAACKEVPLDDDYELERQEPVQIPRELRHLAASGVTSLTIAAERQQQPICIDIHWYEDVRDFSLLTPDQRFLGFDLIGNETGGYLVVDRRGEPHEIETGAQPVFSPTGRLFASAEWSESMFGNLNDIGVWEVTEGGTKRLFKVPEAQSEIFNGSGDWRAERWSGETCVVLSAARSDPTNAGVEVREYMQLKRERAGWKLSPTSAKQACVP